MVNAQLYFLKRWQSNANGLAETWPNLTSAFAGHWTWPTKPLPNRMKMELIEIDFWGIFGLFSYFES